ncbi:hypothetical protein BZA70DRAFT_310392 [Myxozyma melibiosi]|uniref:NADH:flavin oxidoreductase/NADH oxidase N-terminal domain-containing protein n=1 Tax=Myxozyma melibiosi TaxID=54550 RepID=A0ABR1F832_9ASCO
MPALFEPIKVGTCALSNRIVMAPLTRFRNDDALVPIPELMPEHYAARCLVPGTLIIGEATDICELGGGYNNVPGIYTDAQVAGWKKVTDAVHAKGGFMFLQLWALGRVNPGNKVTDVTGASAIKDDSVDATPREMTTEEVVGFEDAYVHASKCAIAAGFDGIEIHGAHGYLVDQFLQDVSNKRTDIYGGSVENRARFALNIIDKVSAAIGEEKVAIRLSPFNNFQGMGMKDHYPTFSYVISQIEAKHPKLAYLHVVEPRVSGGADREVHEGETTDVYKKLWSGPWIAAGGFTPETALKYAEEHENSLVAFGRYFISNPDLVAKIKEGIPLTPYNRDTFYLPKDPKGYLDYSYAEELKGKYY